MQHMRIIELTRRSRRFAAAAPTRAKRFLAVAALAIAPAAILPAQAAELVVFERAGCAWCVRWNAEVGAVYDKTAEGRQAPARRVDLGRGVPADLAQVKPVVYTPTFVLVEDGKEIGRIEGYSDDAFFYAYLGGLLGKLKPAAN